MLYYVLQVETGKELEFKRGFDRLLAQTLEGEVYVPIRELEIRRRGKPIKERKPVFPGYVFWITEAWDPDQPWQLRQLPSFYRFVGKKGIPRPLNDHDLELLKHFMHIGSVLGQSLVRFDDDQRIVVMQGPMKGLEGQIVRVDKRKKRARVRLDLYESTFEIDFGFELLAAEDS